jgi:hypothetical protein
MGEASTWTNPAATWREPQVLRADYQSLEDGLRSGVHLLVVNSLAYESHLDRLRPSAFPALQADLDAIRVSKRVGHNLFHHTAGQLPRPLVLLGHNRNVKPWFDLCAYRTVYDKFILLFYDHPRWMSLLTGRVGERANIAFGGTAHSLLAVTGDHPLPPGAVDAVKVVGRDGSRDLLHLGCG